MGVAKLNKLTILIGTGVVAAAGIGITALASQSGPAESSTNEEELEIITESSGPTDTDDSLGSSDLSVLNSLPNTTLSPEELNRKALAEAYTNYEVDEDYQRSLGSWSMGGKFRDDVILAPKGSQAWKYKAEKVKKRMKTSEGGRNGLGFNWHYKTLYNGGNKENIDEKDINGQKLYSLCSDILSHGDYGIRFTRISRLNRKGFFDFVWEICGRDDKTKPYDGKFSH